VDDPLALFRSWLAEATAAGAPLPEAMTLATADATGRPTARTVLLNGVDERGFLFFTSYESRKARQLAENSQAALVFHWHTEPRRQVLVEGPVEVLSRSESGEYFTTRPVGSRHGAWASRQSSPIESRETLEHAFAEAERRFGENVPLPDWWGGYVLRPAAVEFWESRPNRLHERIRYTRGEDGPWTSVLLSP
jgi:pyridoxamine 5'-phosphate oxidase